MLAKFDIFVNTLQNNPRLESELAAGFVRANNGLNPAELTAFVGILSITLDPSTLYSVEGGNIQLIQRLLAESSKENTLRINFPYVCCIEASVRLNSAVTKVKKIPGDSPTAHAKFEVTVGTDVPEVRTKAPILSYALLTSRF